jgi:hypothetical protein
LISRWNGALSCPSSSMVVPIGVGASVLRILVEAPCSTLQFHGNVDE